MNVVEKVKGLAKARGIPIYILERECDNQKADGSCSDGYHTFDLHKK